MRITIKPALKAGFIVIQPSCRVRFRLDIP